MTVRGIICTVIETVLLVLALGSGYRELIVVAFCLGVFMALSLLSMLLVILTARAGSSLSLTEVQRRDEVAYMLTISGIVLLPVTGYLAITAPGIDPQDKKARQQRAFLLLPTFRGRQMALTLPCTHMGLWPVGPVYLRYEDLFGLFRFSLTKSRLTHQLTVYPRIHDLGEDREKAVAAGFSESQVRSASSGENLGDTRQYQPGDALKRIHWKLSARTRELYTREFEMQENAQVLVVMDMQCRSEDTRSTLDIAAETVLSVLAHFTEAGKAVRLLPVRSYGRSVLTESRVASEPELQEVQAKLLSVALHHTQEPLEVWELRDAGFTTVGTVFVVTDHPSPSLISALDAQVSAGQAVVCLVPCVGMEPPEHSGGQVQTVVLNTPEEIGEKVGGCL
ncbi:MAG: DUF58 domain-containing protein [Clostridia bacterium]|nr:DUF58 domain-containing protein [Clostridia bacterium]